MRAHSALIAFLLAFGNQNITASCISMDGETISSGFIDCVKKGNRYVGDIDDSIVNFLLGAWSSNCSDAKSKVVNERDSNGLFISRLYNFDSKDNIFKSSTYLEVLGLRSVGGLIYVAAKTHSISEQKPSGPQENIADYVLIVYKKIDENTRLIEDGYTIKDGVVDQEIKDGVLVGTNEKVMYFRCLVKPTK